MDVKGVFHFIVFLFMFFFFFTLVAACGSKKNSEDLLLVNLINSVEINRDMVELLWLNCRIELVHANEAVEDYAAEEDSSVRDEFLVKSKPEKHKRIGYIHPLVKKALLGCLREKDLLFLICGEEKGSPNWYARCVEFLFSWHGALKHRKLKASPNPPPAPPNSKSSKSRDDTNSKKKSTAKDTAVATTSVLIALLCICCCCCKYCRRSKRVTIHHKSSALGSSLNSSPNDDSKIEIRRTGPAGMPPLKPPPDNPNPTPPPPPAQPKTPAPAAPPPPPVKPSSGGPSPSMPGPPPPPPMNSGSRPPPGSPTTGLKPPRRSPLGPKSSTEEEDTDASKAKLKPFSGIRFKPTPTNQWFGIKSSQTIDQKKAQNLSILLKALNMTNEEVCDALKEGNELPAELIQTLLKMAPTAEEELNLRIYNGELSPLGQAEQFLKALVEVPFAFKRLETLLLMCTLQDEASMFKESFATLEAASIELRNSRQFLKLLEAVLKTGNWMNDGMFRGGAHAFKLDTLLKLSDVKGIDGKTTLLHFVVSEIIHLEGIRAARAANDYRNTGLQVVSSSSSHLGNVKSAAVLDADNLTGNTLDFLNSEMKNIDDKDGFHQTMKKFMQNAEGEVMSLLEDEKRIMALLKSTGDYFQGHAKRDEVILDKVCKEVKNAPRKLNSTPRRENATITTSESTLSPRTDQSTHSAQLDQSVPSERPDQSIASALPDQRQKFFPAITDRQVDDFSSDDDNP
ncbi:unnamed protein product [Withania somnifera]